MKKKTFCWIIILIAVCHCLAIAGSIFSPMTFMFDVQLGEWTSMSNIVSGTTSGGAYTNGPTTNYYRMSGTNFHGRIPVSSNIVVSFDGSPTNLTNAVTLSWDRYDGLRSYIVEQSHDGGATWTNWLTLGPRVTNWTDYGTNSWTSSVFTNVHSTLIPAPISHFGAGGSETSTIAEVIERSPDARGGVITNLSEMQVLTNRIQYLEALVGSLVVRSNINADGNSFTNLLNLIASGTVTADELDVRSIDVDGASGQIGFDGNNVRFRRGGLLWSGAGVNPYMGSLDDFSDMHFYTDRGINYIGRNENKNTYSTNIIFVTASDTETNSVIMDAEGKVFFPKDIYLTGRFISDGNFTNRIGQETLIDPEGNISSGPSYSVPDFGFGDGNMALGRWNNDVDTVVSLSSSVGSIMLGVQTGLANTNLLLNSDASMQMTRMSGGCKAYMRSDASLQLLDMTDAEAIMEYGGGRLQLGQINGVSITNSHDGAVTIGAVNSRAEDSLAVEKEIYAGSNLTVRGVIVLMPYLPTSTNDLKAGTLWRDPADGHTLKVTP